jgi:hypothetical protein
MKRGLVVVIGDSISIVPENISRNFLYQFQRYFSIRWGDLAQLFVLSLPGPARDGVRLFPSIWDRFVRLRLPCLQVRGKSKLRKCGKIAGASVAVPFGRSGIERQQGFRCCFFRKRLALATARACHGETGEASDVLPALDTKRDADRAAASDFSLTIRRYSPGEQSF